MLDQFLRFTPKRGWQLWYSDIRKPSMTTIVPRHNKANHDSHYIQTSESQAWQLLYPDIINRLPPRGWEPKMRYMSISLPPPPPPHPLKGRDSPVGKASNRKPRRNTDTGLSCQGIFLRDYFQCGLSYSVCAGPMCSHMHQHLCMLKIPNIGSHTIVWTHKNTTHWLE